MGAANSFPKRFSKSNQLLSTTKQSFVASIFEVEWRADGGEEHKNASQVEVYSIREFHKNDPNFKSL